MIIDHCLRDAICAIDLSSWETRRGAAALAIVLLEKILRAEAQEPGCLDRHFARLECGLDDCCLYDDLFVIGNAASMLYKAYDFRHYQRLGISSHLGKIGGRT